LTYYRRHKGQALLLVGIVVLATLGVYALVGMLAPIRDHMAYVSLGPLTRFSMVYPEYDRFLDPAVVSQIRANPDIARVIPENGMGLGINVPSLASMSSTRVLGVPGEDLQVLLDACDLRLKEGRLPQPSSSELLVSEEFAAALGLQIGDQVDRSVDESLYRTIKAPVTVVGILESEPGVVPERKAYLILLSYEYLSSHELYSPRQSGVLVIAREGRQAAVQDFLEDVGLSSRTHLETHSRTMKSVLSFRQTLYLIIGTVDLLVTVVVTAVVGVINRIALARRITDLGVLHAVGHRKRRLTRFLALETTIQAAVGWAMGVGLAWLLLAWLRSSLYQPHGMDLNPADVAPLLFTLPIPLAVVGVVTSSIARTFARFDAVSIVERGKLSSEASAHSPTVKHSSANPLSSVVFYLRHRRRALMLTATLALAILGVVFPAFVFVPLVNTQRLAYVNPFRAMSQVSPLNSRAVAPATLGQIRADPAVARVVQVRELLMVVSVPPGAQIATPVYGVSEEDIPYILDALGMELKEGHLPRARSNEIVISDSLAANRDLGIGDPVGRGASELDQLIPTELVVAGILQPRSAQALPAGGGSMLLGLASYEYLESHELCSLETVSLFVIPHAGQKDEFDTWLEENAEAIGATVWTYAMASRSLERASQGLFLVIAVSENIVAAVVAIALAALNAVFFSQRQDEFGVLHALGKWRVWLLWRTVRETASVVGLAWLAGAAVCVAGLLLAQARIYAPKGLTMDFLSPVPWLFSLPIPLAVITASAGIIAWMLYRLDPVALIERR
jgi:putative ABC transport system permease protein/lipoprotein-releasing system permease protein